MSRIVNGILSVLSSPVVKVTTKEDIVFPPRSAAPRDREYIAGAPSRAKRVCEQVQQRLLRKYTVSDLIGPEDAATKILVFKNICPSHYREPPTKSLTDILPIVHFGP